MAAIIFECEILTPMFLGGAGDKGSDAELSIMLPIFWTEKKEK
jgi:hypothetical protein